MAKAIALIPVPHRRQLVDLVGVRRILAVLEELALVGLLTILVFGGRDATAVAIFLIAGVFIAVVEAHSYTSRLVGRRRAIVPFSASNNSTADSQRILTCHGEPSELADLEDLPCELEEPAIFRYECYGRTGALSSRSPYGVVKIVIVLSAGVGAFYYVRNDPVLFFVVVVLFKWGIDRLAAIWSGVYYRVLPGRLDVLRFRPWSSRARSCESFDLGAASIICRYDRGTVNIRVADRSIERAYVQEPSDAPGVDSLTIELEGLIRRHAFVRAIFEAALSARETPPVPRDSLLG